MWTSYPVFKQCQTVNSLSIVEAVHPVRVAIIDIVKVNSTFSVV